MLKLEVFDFEYVFAQGVNVSEGVCSDIISYNNGDILFLDETRAKGYYFVSTFSTTNLSAAMRRKETDYLLLKDKVYTIKEEPVYYA